MAPTGFAALPLLIASTFGGGFLVNEWSHGALSETVGLGHHHMLDYGGYHCSAYNATAYGDHHMMGRPPQDLEGQASGCAGYGGMHGANQTMMPHGNGTGMRRPFSAQGFSP